MSHTFLTMIPQINAFKDGAKLIVSVQDHYVLHI